MPPISRYVTLLKLRFHKIYSVENLIENINKVLDLPHLMKCEHSAKDPFKKPAKIYNRDVSIYLYLKPKKN